MHKEQHHCPTLGKSPTETAAPDPEYEGASRCQPLTTQQVEFPSRLTRCLSSVLCSDSMIRIWLIRMRNPEQTHDSPCSRINTTSCPPTPRRCSIRSTASAAGFRAPLVPIIPQSHYHTRLQPTRRVITTKTIELYIPTALHPLSQTRAIRH